MRKGNVTGATSGASSGPPTLPPLLCCCCCSAVVVRRSSCVSLLCIPKLYSFTLELGAVHASSHKIYGFYCCVVPLVEAHLKKTQALEFEVYSPNKTERQVPSPSPLLLMPLLQLYCLCCAMLLLSYSHRLGLLCVPTAQIQHSNFSCTCRTSCSPHNICGTYVKRRGWRNTAGCFMNQIHLFPA